jgi:23S rRNA (cytosine1962-C5)-methyltransferase
MGDNSASGARPRPRLPEQPAMPDPIPTVRLKNAWHSTHPWIFQRLVEKPAQRPKPGSIVDVAGVDGTWIGRGFYNGHSRIALRMLETDPDVDVDADWFARKIGEAVGLRRDTLRLDEVSNAWRVFHSEGDGISGLVVDRYDDLLVVEFFSAGAWRHREWIFNALRGLFPGCRFHSFADEHVQKQESFDYRDTLGTQPAVVSEHGIRFRADPAGAHKTGFFADQRENREWLSRLCAGKRVLDLCCNTGGFAVYAAVRGAGEVVGIDIDAAVIDIAKENAHLNKVKPRFVQADIFPWLRDAANNGERFDVVVLDPAKMTRDREQVIPALKKYLDMNKLALGVVEPGGLFATFSCTGLVSEEQFLDTLRRAAYYAGRTVQVLKVAGAAPDHPFLAQVPESRYLKAVFCRVLD